MTVEMSQKKEIIDQYKINDKDTGSSQVQVAILTTRIKQLTEHLKVHKKDKHTHFGLMKLIHRRRGLLNYLKKNCRENYQTLIASLGIRS